MNNELVPDLIKDLISKYNKATSPNEKMNLLMRLEAIASVVNQAIISNSQSLHNYRRR